MRNSFAKYCWLVICIGVLSATSCDHHKHSTGPDNRTVLRIGQTSGGRLFQVIQEQNAENFDEIKVAIDGEHEVVLETVAGIQRTQVDSVLVLEYPGNRPLVHIEWHTFFYSLSSSTDYHYIVFVKGAVPPDFLLTGSGTFIYDGHYLFQWSKGSYQLSYANQTVSIEEQWVEGGDRDLVCYAAETKRFRAYHVEGFTETSLERCEEYSRNVSVVRQVSGPCNIDMVRAALDNTRWTATPMTPDDVLKKCQPRNSY
ncbi:hypothetical protein U27_00676 [Candidatus Vecturithrix granuli]|uniref:Lipoprotein n=1 Tax=Vecturithrix granuli TaxID=1499967 RepID=A0A081C873_VECG1|nr:hypothetical protein U27_00676 [Candidatus Vecturithrix granuli]